MKTSIEATPRLLKGIVKQFCKQNILDAILHKSFFYTLKGKGQLCQ